MSSSAARPGGTRVGLANGTVIGDRGVVIMAGPCAVESEAQLFTVAQAVADSGATVLRGGAYKPRTSPYSFQGLEEEALVLLSRARQAYGLAIVTEAVDAASADRVARHADLIQIGARNMQNFSLLRHVGRMHRPVLLKRGLAATLDELLSAAEYLLAEGCQEVVLCERGIRSFDGSTRNVLDLAAVAALKARTHLPVVVDPSHGTGRRELVGPMARAAVAVGADGVMLEVHHQPAAALSDGAQSIEPGQLRSLMGELQRVATAVDRTLATAVR